jgi:hypothetical protein
MREAAGVEMNEKKNCCEKKLCENAEQDNGQKQGDPGPTL